MKERKKKKKKNGRKKLSKWLKFRESLFIQAKIPDESLQISEQSSFKEDLKESSWISLLKKRKKEKKKKKKKKKKEIEIEKEKTNIFFLLLPANIWHSSCADGFHSSSSIESIHQWLMHGRIDQVLHPAPRVFHWMLDYYRLLLLSWHLFRLQGRLAHGQRRQRSVDQHSHQYRVDCGAKRLPIR